MLSYAMIREILEYKGLWEKKVIHVTEFYSRCVTL